MASYVIDLKDELSASAKAMAQAMTALTNAMKATAPAADGVDKKVSGLGKGFAKFSESIDPSTKGMSMFSDAAGSLGAVLNPATLAVSAIGLAAAVTVGVIVGLTGALYEMAKAAISVTQARTQMVATFDALTEGAGTKTLGALSALAERLPFTTGQLAGWAKSMAAAGVSGVGLTNGVRAAAAATAIMGDEAGAATAKLIAKLSATEAAGAKFKIDKLAKSQLAEIGLSANDLVKQLGVGPGKLATLGVSAGKAAEAIQNALIQKGKPALTELGLTWTSISAKISEGGRSLFADLAPAVKPFMTEVKSLFSEFFKGSNVMNSTKGIVTSVMTEVFAIASKVVRGIHIGFLTAAIAVLQLATAAAPTVKWLRTMWAEHDGAGKLMLALKGLAVVAGLVAVPILMAIGALVAMGAIGGAVITGIGVALSYVPLGLQKLGEAFQAAAGLGLDFAMGIGRGIASGVTWVIDAAKNLGASAVSAIKSVLQISSPSRLMAEQGMYTAEGLAVGIRGGTSQAVDASREMGLAVADSGAGARGGLGKGRSGGPVTISVTVNNSGVDSQGSLLQLTEEAIASVFERFALSQGLLETEAVPA